MIPFRTHFQNLHCRPIKVHFQMKNRIKKLFECAWQLEWVKHSTTMIFIHTPWLITYVNLHEPTSEMLRFSMGNIQMNFTISNTPFKLVNRYSTFLAWIQFVQNLSDSILKWEYSQVTLVRTHMGCKSIHYQSSP
jgi:hypothetical protein